MPDVQPILQAIAEHRVKIVSLRFTDLGGRMRQLAVEATRVDAAFLTTGVTIDGSAMPGWLAPNEPDPVLIPDLGAWFLDPFAAQPTLSIWSMAHEAGTVEPFERCPRAILQRAIALVARKQRADRIQIGAELGFSIFDDVQIDAEPCRLGYRLASAEGVSGWGAAYQGGNQGHRPQPRRAWLAAPPADHFADLRSEIATVLAAAGVPGVTHLHGRGAAQHVLMLPPEDALALADHIQLAKYVIQSAAMGYGKSATFLPKPCRDDQAVDLVLSLGLFQDRRPLFHGAGYADLSDACLSFLAGILAHGAQLAAFTNPSSNSYRRLRPGQEVPTVLAYAAHNRSAAIRIPHTIKPGDKRIELRFPDPLANPYLAIAAILLAGLDGVAGELDPGDPIDRNLYDLPQEEVGLAQLPRTLDLALDALEAERQFLIGDDVFTAPVLDAYIAIKRDELDEIAAAPHPIELRQHWSS